MTRGEAALFAVSSVLFLLYTYLMLATERELLALVALTASLGLVQWMLYRRSRRRRD